MSGGRWWPVLGLLVVWAAVAGASSLAVGNLFGLWAQVLFLLPMFLLSLILGTWLGRHLL